MSADAVEVQADRQMLRLASNLRCVDGSMFSIIAGSDAATRRQMVKSMASGVVRDSSHSIFVRHFLATGVIDQLRFMW